MRTLLEAGIEIDVYPIYPLDAKLWRYVPDILNDHVLPRNKVHHVSVCQGLYLAVQIPVRKIGSLLCDTSGICLSAARYGVKTLAKSLYVIPKACAWSVMYPHSYDHILAYWGNYAGTCAYLFHGLLNHKVPFSIFLHAGTDLYRDRVYLKQKLLAAQNIVTCSEFNRSFICQQYPDISFALQDKIHVYHHGLDFSELPYSPNDRHPMRVLAVGSFFRKKGFDYLIKAAHRLLRRGVDLEVELVGDGPESSSLRSLSRKLGISDKVRFRGWLSFDEVRDTMQKATILAHPSTGLGDGIPNVIKEFMALGGPVIASNVAGIPEALDGGRCGLLVPPKDVSALANAIETLLADIVLRCKFADAARQYAEKKFDLWRNGKRLAEVFYTTPKLL
jgi:glycosyltransferase involved in cell wall biosynthesis